MQTTTKVIIQKIVKAKSFGNGFYDWELITPKTIKAKSELAEWIERFESGKMKLKLFEQMVKIYCEAFYDETGRVWQEDMDEKLRIARREEFRLRIPEIPISAKELEFMENRFASWNYKEGMKLTYNNTYSGFEEYLYSAMEAIRKGEFYETPETIERDNRKKAADKNRKKK